MENSTNETTNNAKIKEANDEKQRFISDDKYQLLQHYQQLISKATDLSPTIKKLVNELITAENLEEVTVKLIDSLSE